MSSNSMTDYVEAFRANLPAGITFDATLNRYFCNDRRYLNEWEVESYLNYVKKFGFTAISAYAILGFEPPLVLDFDENYFRTGGTATDLVSAATHTRAGNATMVDSDGVLKWAPHNLLTYSEDATTARAIVNVSRSGNDSGTTAPDGTTTATRLESTAVAAASLIYRNPADDSIPAIKRLWVKSDGWRWIHIRPAKGTNWVQSFDVLNGVKGLTGSNIVGTPTITPSVNGWYLLEVEADEDSLELVIGFAESDTLISNPSVTGNGSGIWVWGEHSYRSDLGGMANDPATGDSYVPTTDAARHLPRVGHHIWNGSAWVDEGYFHESEARTNLLFNSDTLATQSVTVTAVPHTLHFTGTGTVTLTGASTAGPLVGTGTGENNRVSLTFTPTAGTLTVTVSGTVTNAGLEVGSTLSSYIPTAGAEVIRAADAMTIPAANLPWPEPVVIGPELVTNGTFDSDSDWTLNGTAEISSGTAKNLTGGDYIAQGFTTEAGKYYQLTFDALPGSNTGNSLIRIGTWPNSFSIQNTGLGTPGTGLIRRFVATSTTTWVTFYQANFTAEYDNISVREINPLAVSIQMEGTVTYADEGSLGQQTFFQWKEDNDTQIRVNLDTNSVNTGSVRFRQEVGGVVYDSFFSNVYSPGINVPFNIASRHGSTFINGAVDGTALTADLTPTALPYLENTDMQIGYDFNGTIKLVRVWADDLTDEGVAEASAVEFDPVSLFASGEEGAWYDPADLNTLFQDTAGTIPVTASGQTVARINDKSGNGNHATQEIIWARPTYKTDGTLHWLEFDGVGDFMVTPAITPDIDKSQIFIGARRSSENTAILVETGPTIATTNGTLGIFYNSSLGYNFSNRGTSRVLAQIASSVSPISHVISGIGDITEDITTIRLNQSAATELGDLGSGNYSTQPLYIGRRVNGDFPFDGNVYGLILRFGANLEVNTIGQVEVYISDKTGVVL